ncbi:MAG: imelysin family protein, partial [Bacteroidota bacterium]
MKLSIGVVSGLVIGVLIGLFLQPTSTPKPSPNLKAAVENHAAIVLASYEDSKKDAEALVEAVKTFVNDPNPETHTAAKNAWLNAQESYGQTEVYRFYGGPIDGENGPEGQLNAWPLDESLIDYVETPANGGEQEQGVNIINSPESFPSINKEVIAELNEYEGSETNVATGYHAVEFLLWGQDNYRVGTGSGDRSFTDYVIDGSGTNSNQDRRGQYLIAAAELIVEGLSYLIDQWSMDGAYRSVFTSEDQLERSFQKIIN